MTLLVRFRSRNSLDPIRLVLANFAIIALDLPALEIDARIDKRVGEVGDDVEQ